MLELIAYTDPNPYFLTYAKALTIHWPPKPPLQPPHTLSQSLFHPRHPVKISVIIINFILIILLIIIPLAKHILLLLLLLWMLQLLLLLLALLILIQIPKILGDRCGSKKGFCIPSVRVASSIIWFWSITPLRQPQQMVLLILVLLLLLLLLTRILIHNAVV